MRTVDAALAGYALVGYALASPFVLWPPLSERMGNRRDTGLLAVARVVPGRR